MSDSAEWRARRAILTELAAQSLTQTKLARRVGVTEKHICCVLKGHARLSFDFAERMLAALDRRLDVDASQPYQADRPPPPEEPKWNTL